MLHFLQEIAGLIQGMVNPPLSQNIGLALGGIGGGIFQNDEICNFQYSKIFKTLKIREWNLAKVNKTMMMMMMMMMMMTTTMMTTMMTTTTTMMMMMTTMMTTTATMMMMMMMMMNILSVLFLRKECRCSRVLGISTIECR